MMLDGGLQVNLYLYVVHVELCPLEWVRSMAVDVDPFRIFRDFKRGVSVFVDKGRLSLDFVPDVLVYREVEERRLARVLMGVLDGYLPPMVRVFGRPGTGKTVLVRSVLERFSRFYGEAGFRFYYLNLKGCKTVFSAANAVLSALSGRRLPVNLGVDRVFHGIWDEIRALKRGGRLFIVFALDEVDAIFFDRHFNPSDFFYRFLRHRVYLEDPAISISLFAITNNPWALESLDGRVKSSMGSEVVMFSAYSKEELVDILRARAMEAFRPGGLGEGVIELCAELVSGESGDARRAIDLLRVCGEVADEVESEKVERGHVEKAWSRVEREWVEEVIEDLPENAKRLLALLAEAVLDRERVTVKELYGAYKEYCSERGLTPLGEKRVLDLVNEMDMLGVVEALNLSRGRYGYAKVVSLRLDAEAVLDLLDPEWRKRRERRLRMREIEEKLKRLERRRRG